MAEDFQKIAEKMASEKDTDVLVYIGGINMGSARRLVDDVSQRKRLKNLFFVLGTNGGDAHAGYKIARCLQHAYEGGRVTIGVYGDCKSAGTLIAISAHTIVMGQHGELGPLDVQLHKEDQLFAQLSGLTTKQALESLKEEVLLQFEHFMLSIHARSGYQISTRLAASIGIRLTVGLLGPIYEQIDPMKIGETQRAMNVARAYGERLNTHANLKDGALEKLIEGYPSHDFAIDFDEARSLFQRLIQVDKDQGILGENLAHLLLRFKSISQDEAIVVYLNRSEAEIESKKEREKTDNDRSEHADPTPEKSSSDRSGEHQSSTGSAGSGSEKPSDKDGQSGAGTTVKASGNGAETALSVPSR